MALKDLLPQQQNRIANPTTTGYNKNYTLAGTFYFEVVCMYMHT